MTWDICGKIISMNTIMAKMHQFSYFFTTLSISWIRQRRMWGRWRNSAI